jgi:hypothetical protein
VSILDPLEVMSCVISLLLDLIVIKNKQEINKKIHSKNHKKSNLRFLSSKMSN